MYTDGLTSLAFAIILGAALAMSGVGLSNCTAQPDGGQLHPRDGEPRLSGVL